MRSKNERRRPAPGSIEFLFDVRIPRSANPPRLRLGRRRQNLRRRQPRLRPPRSARRPMPAIRPGDLRLRHFGPAGDEIFGAASASVASRRLGLALAMMALASVSPRGLVLDLGPQGPRSLASRRAWSSPDSTRATLVDRLYQPAVGAEIGQEPEKAEQPMATQFSVSSIAAPQLLPASPLKVSHNSCDGKCSAWNGGNAPWPAGASVWAVGSAMA